VAQLGIIAFDAEGFGLVGHRSMQGGRVDERTVGCKQVGVVEAGRLGLIDEALQ
jgi:hypothetical protein